MRNQRGFSTALILGILFALLPANTAQSWDEHPTTNPFPGVAFGEEIPGYTKIAVCSDTPEVPDNCVRRTGQPDCPAWSANDVTPTLRGDGSWASAKLWCRASWTPPVTQAQEDAYRQAIEDAQRAAEAESRAWNEANPGKQKCVQWGPIKHPNGVGESSGGVCANPVPAGTAPSGSQTVDAPSVGEGDVSGATTTSPAPTQTSSPATTSSSPAAGLDPDPTPTGGVDFRGSGYPYTVVVLGQVGVSGCPIGFQAANGLISDVSTRKVYTECWPERAWAAYRLGGEAWELFKATGGSYDPSIEVERRSKVELLKSKAKAVAEAAAKETPGIERCSSWSGFGESGRECAYAFVAPSSSSPSAPNSLSATVSDSVVVVVSSSPTATQSVVVSSDSNTVSGSIAVALDTVQVSGTSLLVAKTALSVTPDPVEAASISAFAEDITGVRTVQRTLLQTLPRDPVLSYKVTSATPGVCKASSWRVRISNPGLCLLNVEITDSFGNSYEIVKRMRRSF